ncbi:DNA-directed RNA polymerase, omega subunit [Halanaerobium saccharolyticum subsp. saccharolyticum DSM 6643]|uniref:DNA-directed RNA polymerase subunit omega n=1 Tax=Halanaerobium saccharolyticum subsp. saccharolyticum DSM 6643 TaxID=1293054 RepID=M5E161_9FIRM|nr:DNA-directed RNA polymerase subunit omega [Halanaerobium saccharolyticum]CCU79539.1 DNA-directed RNA polymerase, omega subunit [Halanaerobium saccharolyticum subsp. saccharolyticum DSM 6643]
MITEPSAEQLVDKADSLFTVIILASKRARHLNENGPKLLENYRSEKLVSRSLEEIEKDKITYEKRMEAPE